MQLRNQPSLEREVGCVSALWFVWLLIPMKCSEPMLLAKREAPTGIQCIFLKFLLQSTLPFSWSQVWKKVHLQLNAFCHSFGLPIPKSVISSRKSKKASRHPLTWSLGGDRSQQLIFNIIGCKIGQSLKHFHPGLDLKCGSCAERFGINIFGRKACPWQLLSVARGNTALSIAKYCGYHAVQKTL